MQKKSTLGKKKATSKKKVSKQKEVIHVLKLKVNVTSLKPKEIKKFCDLVEASAKKSKLTLLSKKVKVKKVK